MSSKPRIAVIMDENTSVDGARHDMTKNYFVAIHRAGGMPFGTPYFPAWSKRSSMSSTAS